MEMKIKIRVEESIILLLGIYLYSQLSFSWGIFFLLLFIPDIGMMGYLKNPQIGATIYNIFHHRGIALVVYLIGVIVTSNILMLIGIILFVHSTMDRMFGYGLKYSDQFKHTHLEHL